MTTSGAPDDPDSRPSLPSWGAGVRAATGAALGRPAAWPVALAGQLIRGGLVPFALPIVVLPTVTGLATALGPAVISIALGQPNDSVARLIATSVAAVMTWLMVNVLLGAATDAVVVRWIAGDLEDAARATPVRSVEVMRVAIVRATADLPLLVATLWGAARLVEVTRRELIMPGDLAAPIVLRVIAGAPEVIAMLLLTWLVGEAIGELATRSVMLEGASAAQGLGRAVRRGVGHLSAVLATLLLGTAGLVLLVVPAIVAAAAAWTGLRGVLLDDGPVVLAVVGALVLSIAWLGGLALAAVAATWRSALWTAEALRHLASDPIAAPRAGAAIVGAPPAG